MEFNPLEENLEKGMKHQRSEKEMFEFNANLYINYIETYKKLEDVYDQLLHPQKRVLLRKMLDNTIKRILELKIVKKI